MRVGLLARCDSRGLGVQSWELARALDPSVLMVDVADAHARAEVETYRPHFDRHPGATRALLGRGGFDEQVVRQWLDTVDVIYSAETLYDPRFGGWAHDAGVATVVHTNPEFHRARKGWTDPTVWWAPTSWRLEHLPAGTEVVPVPVALDRWPEPVVPHDGPCRWLHVVGKRALADRNGTDAVCAALPFLREPCTVTFVVQDPSTSLHVPGAASCVDVRIVAGGVDYWTIYADHDALVMPRRYGGLCLPAQEAMGAGLAVLMTDVPPNRETWPVATVPVLPGVRHQMPGGAIEAAEIDPRQLAAAMDALADPAVRHDRQAAARDWARGHSWAALAGLYLEQLATARSIARVSA